MSTPATPEELQPGTDVIVHTDHIFLRCFDGERGKVIGAGTFTPDTVEVAFTWVTAEFLPTELEVAA